MAVLNFDALRDLHDSANDLLHSPVIKREIATHRQEKLVHEVSEASLRMLEVCGTTKDVVLRVKDHLHDLRSAFRRIMVGETACGESKLQVYRCDRKKLRKDMMKRMNSLKGMRKKNACLAAAFVAGDGEREEMSAAAADDLRAVVNVLREVRAATIAMVEAVMSLMSMPCPDRPAARGSSPSSFAAKLMRVNSLSRWEKCDAVTLQCANTRLEAVEMAVGDLEWELEAIIRRLIRTRVSLLNILTN
ncbi:PREDICTED: uncharacterized protein LOC109181230 [Ipomoea nil]|uniref:uncharacterized protein LOC109181230 n=1 Tax=Ipomoea nil TaxID=35883 RepID=UPI000900A1F5|nr:PREDICTED: uncharacterized protein LOC109181230 [Ipomoea nil]